MCGETWPLCGVVEHLTMPGGAWPPCPAWAAECYYLAQVRRGEEDVRAMVVGVNLGMPGRRGGQLPAPAGISAGATTGRGGRGGDSGRVTR